MGVVDYEFVGCSAYSYLQLLMIVLLFILIFFSFFFLFFSLPFSCPSAMIFLMRHIDLMTITELGFSLEQAFDDTRRN